MAPTVYSIDPVSDTIITLKNPCISFAQWEPSAAEIQPPRPHLKKGKKKAKRVKEAAVETDSSHGAGSDSAMGSSYTDQTATAVDVGTSEPVIPPPPLEPATECMDIYYYVSSRHLMLASPMFSCLLAKDGFAESHRSESGFFHINASDWDTEAFLIVLQILHLRNKQVPRVVSLKMLAKIAVIVDYYSCGEAIELFAEMWIQRLKNTPLPTTYCRDIVLWIWIAYTFDSQDCFEKATAVAIRDSKESLRTMGLPIPERLSSEIESKRYQAIESIVEGLHALLSDYRSAKYVCPMRHDLSFECGSFLLGALSKGMDGMALLDPRPEVPFENLSFDVLCGEIPAMRSPSWYENRTMSHGCRLNTATTALIHEASAAVTGLEINLGRARGLSHDGQAWLQLIRTKQMS